MEKNEKYEYNWILQVDVVKRSATVYNNDKVMIRR